MNVCSTFDNHEHNLVHFYNTHNYQSNRDDILLTAWRDTCTAKHINRNQCFSRSRKLVGELTRTPLFVCQSRNGSSGSVSCRVNHVCRGGKLRYHLSSFGGKFPSCLCPILSLCVPEESVYRFGFWAVRIFFAWGGSRLNLSVSQKSRDE